MEDGAQRHHACWHRDLPRGPVQMKADRIAYACYRITYPAEAAAVLEQYNALESAPVEKHSKKGNKIVELKDISRRWNTPPKGRASAWSSACLLRRS